MQDRIFQKLFRHLLKFSILEQLSRISLLLTEFPLNMKINVQCIHTTVVAVAKQVKHLLLFIFRTQCLFNEKKTPIYISLINCNFSHLITLKKQSSLLSINYSSSQIWNTYHVELNVNNLIFLTNPTTFGWLINKHKCLYIRGMFLK